MSAPILKPAPSEEQKAAALAALGALGPFFADGSQMTEDEMKALGVVKEALEAIAIGEDLNPPADGLQKMRLIRRIEFRFFVPLAPRPRVVVQEARRVEEVDSATLAES